MASENNFLKDMDFKKRIEKMGDRALLEDIAFQVYETCRRCDDHGKRLTVLEARDNKTYGIVSAIAAGFGAGITLIINMFVQK